MEREEMFQMFRVWAGRPSVLLPTEKSRLFFINSQSLPTGVDRIDAERPVTSQNVTAEGPATNAIIGILDTGIDLNLNHPDLNVDRNLSRSLLFPKNTILIVLIVLALKKLA